MRIHFFQHVAFEGLGCIEAWATDNHHELSVTRFHHDGVVPQMDDIDWLIVMGGPMNIYEEAKYPWLVREKQCIREAISSGKKVLGICLGAQLIADALGGRVTQNAFKEIGWFPVELTPEARVASLFHFLPERFLALHWHGDTFALPPGALHVARSEACENQAFLYGGRVLGLQFHLEFTRQSMDAILPHCADELVPGTYVQTADTMYPSDETFSEMNGVMFGLLDQLASVG